MTSRLGTWWRDRSDRERRLLAAAGAAAALVAAVRLGASIAGDLGAARARLDAQRRELALVHRLAQELERGRRSAPAADGTPLVTRLEAAAAGILGRERIASMTPVAGGHEAISLRLVGASLAEAVRLLHEIERGGLQVEKLDMVKHPDDPGRFDLLLEVAGPAPA